MQSGRRTLALLELRRCCGKNTKQMMWTVAKTRQATRRQAPRVVNNTEFELRESALLVS